MKRSIPLSLFVAITLCVGTLGHAGERRGATNAKDKAGNVVRNMKAIGQNKVAKGGALALIPAEPVAIEAPQHRNLAQRIGSWFGRNFKNNIRGEMAEVKQLQRDGKIAEAAGKLVENADAPKGFRDRLAFNSTRRGLANASMKALKQRTKDGQFGEAADALEGLNTLRDNGKLTFFGFLRMGMAKSKAVRNTRAEIEYVTPRLKWNLRRADSVTALDGLALIADLNTTGKRDGVESRSYKRAEKLTLSRVMKTARSLSRFGDVDRVEGMLADISELKGFDAKQAAAILDKVAKVATKSALRTASRYAQQGAMDEAAQSMFQAMRIEMQLGRNPEGLFRRGGAWSRDRVYSNLRRSLAPRLQQIFAQYQQQMMEQQAAQEKAAEQKPEA